MCKSSFQFFFWISASLDLSDCMWIICAHRRSHKDTRLVLALNRRRERVNGVSQAFEALAERSRKSWWRQALADSIFNIDADA